MNVGTFVVIQTIGSCIVSFLVPWGFLNIVFLNQIFVTTSLQLLFTFLLCPFASSIITGYFIGLLLPEMQKKFNLSLIKRREIRCGSRFLVFFGSHPFWRYSIIRHVVIAVYSFYSILPFALTWNKQFGTKTAFEASTMVATIVCVCHLYTTPLIIIGFLIEDNYQHLLNCFKVPKMPLWKEFLHRIMYGIWA